MSIENELQMEYNTARELMQIPEYGRNIQKMIEYAKTLEDRDERNRAARSIIKVMGQVNPQLKNNEDLTHKLWDHLFIISGFEFDIDFPFEKPVKEDFEKKPDPLPYPKHSMAYRFYGRVVQQMIQEVSQEANDEDRLKMGVAIANVMKRAYLNWNRDSVEDRVIIKDLLKISEGNISLPSDTVLAPSKDLIDPAQKESNQNRGKNNKGKNKNKNKHKKNNNNNNRRNQRNWEWPHLKLQEEKN